MSKFNNLYLLVGPSGCGKTTLAKMLKDLHGMMPVVSYTTRPIRINEQQGVDHLFVTEEEFKTLGKMVAYTEFNGFRYGVTQEVLDKSDLYVIDPAGVDYLKEHMTGDRKIVTIGFLTNQEVCAKHMRARGDTEDMVYARLAHDAKAFAGLPSYCDVMVDGSLDVNNLTEQVWAIIQSYEGKLTYSDLFNALREYISMDADAADPDYLEMSVRGADITDEQLRLLGLGWLAEEFGNESEED